MTRECSADFKEIKQYIESYRINQNLKYPGYISSLKIMHKCYFASITWNAELIHNKADFLAMESSSNEDILLRLIEVVSDLGSSLFNWANGNYKASRIVLRVAVENFIRAVSALEDKGQLVEKNVFHLFEKASSQNMFNGNGNIKKCYRSLHSDYKLLCKDAHTTGVQNMEHLSSLSDLPTFEKLKSDNSAAIYVRVCKNIASVFCIVFNTFYHQMHHRNRENILNSLGSNIRLAITAPEN